MGDNDRSVEVSGDSSNVTAAVNQSFNNGAANANVGVGMNLSDAGANLGYAAGASVPIVPYENVRLNVNHSGGSSSVFGRQSSVGLSVHPTPSTSIGAGVSTNGCSNVGASWNAGNGLNMSAGGFSCGGGRSGGSFRIGFRF